MYRYRHLKLYILVLPRYCYYIRYILILYLGCLHEYNNSVSATTGWKFVGFQRTTRPINLVDLDGCINIKCNWESHFCHFIHFKRSALKGFRVFHFICAPPVDLYLHFFVIFYVDLLKFRNR